MTNDELETIRAQHSRLDGDLARGGPREVTAAPLIQAHSARGWLLVKVDADAVALRNLEASLAAQYEGRNAALTRAEKAEAALLLAREALTPLAHGLDGWPYAADPARDIGRMNYDTSITVADVEKARAVLAETAAKEGM